MYHQSPNCGWRGVEGGGFVFVTYFPESTSVRVGWDALEHQRVAAHGEWPVDDVGVAGDPADVSGAEVEVSFGVQIEDIFCRRRGPNHVARLSM